MTLRNQLLTQLPPHELKQITPVLDRVWLPAGMQLASIEERPDFAYFPETSIVAVVTSADDNVECYVGFYGFEGFGSSSIVLGAPASASHEVVQCAGWAYRIRTADLMPLMAGTGELRRLLLCYVHVLMMQIAYTAFSHSRRVEQRLARLLLMYQDRLRVSSLAVTHQRLSVMLGVRRPGITEALHLLEGAKLIRAQRGLIDILDRPGLQSLTGGCYGKPEAEYRRLI